MLAAVELLRVLEPENHRPQLLLALRALRGELAQDRDAVVDELPHARVARVALILELGLGQQTLGAAGIAREEHEVALRRPVAPRQMEVRGVGRLAVDVSATEREVDGVARVDEVVGVAAEVRRLQVRRHHEPHVVEDAILVELPDAALEQLDELRNQLRALGAGGTQQSIAVLVEQPGDLVGAHPVLHPFAHRRRDIGHAYELLHRQARDPHLVVEITRHEPVAHPVLVALHLRDAAARAVVVRQDQPPRRHERRRAAAAEPQRREPHAVPPGGRPARSRTPVRGRPAVAARTSHLAEAELV